MSTIKSYSVGNGDMFYINHGSDNFTIIDCCISDENKTSILNEISKLTETKGITRFISTHPDDDHMRGIELLDEKINILNFYCVKNSATKEDETDSFLHYCTLRDDPRKAFYIFKDCSRKWMNESDEERGSSGITILWPNVNNKYFKEVLKVVEKGGSPNNISAILKYSLNGGARVLWMGDIETEFMENIVNDVDWSQVDILFAPHHGRGSGKIPEAILQKLDPKIIIIGEAPSEYLNYYPGYNTITQNSAGDIVLDCCSGKVHVFTSNDYDVNYLGNEGESMTGYYYIGTLTL